MARKKNISTKAPAHPAALSVEEELRAEVERQRKALSYSELRVEALNEVLRISKEKYGIDLLKKLAPSSRQPSAQIPRSWHRGT